MEPIGPRIKSAREAKGISIEQAQKDTRISARILNAIEADRGQEVISGSVYLKSFIKKYANYLGLDGASLAGSFTGQKPESKERITPLKKDGKRGNLPAVTKIPVKKIIYAAVIIVFVFLAVKLIVFAGSKTTTFLKSRPRAGHKSAAAKAKPSPRKAVETAAKPASSPPVKAAAPAPQIPKRENLTLTLNTRADVYLKLKADGAVIYDGILKKGSNEKWEAKEFFDISSSRAEALSADLNGTSIGPLGKGVIKGLRLPR